MVVRDSTRPEIDGLFALSQEQREEKLGARIPLAGGFSLAFQRPSALLAP
jgi:hypothetical protein